MTNKVDPLAQVGMWMRDYVLLVNKQDLGEVPFSIRQSVCRKLFDCGCELQDLENILRQFHREKLKPTAYRWLAKEIRDALGDMEHERAAKAKAAR